MLLTHEDRCTDIAEGFASIGVLDDYVVGVFPKEILFVYSLSRRFSDFH